MLLDWMMKRPGACVVVPCRFRFWPVRVAQIELRCGSRLAEETALNQIHPGLAQVFELVFGFDALRRRRDAETSCQHDRSGDHGLAIAAFVGILSERFVDLDLVERENGEIAHGGISRTEIIESHGDPEILELPDRHQMLIAVPNERALGDFKFKSLWLEAGLDQRAKDDVKQFTLLKLNGRNIDRNPEIRRHFRGVRASLLQEPFSDWHDEARRFGKRDELVRREEASRRMPPADQGLDATNSRIDIDHRLIVQFEFAPRDRVAQCALRSEE